MRELFVPAVVALLLGAVLPLFSDQGYNIWVALAIVLASWLVLCMARDLQAKLRNASSVRAGLARLTPSYYGMQLAHLGFAMCVIGAVLTTQYAQELDLKMSPGESKELAGHVFRFESLEQVRGPNYLADEAVFAVTYDGKLVTRLAPQKRRYLASGQVMTEAAISGGLWRDLFVALGEPIGEGAWSVRLKYKPFLRWIWLGPIFMALGSFVTLADRRYRSKVTRTEADETVAGGSHATT